jgi:hypothetical protein
MAPLGKTFATLITRLLLVLSVVTLLHGSAGVSKHPPSDGVGTRVPGLERIVRQLESWDTGIRGQIKSAQRPHPPPGPSVGSIRSIKEREFVLSRDKAVAKFIERLRNDADRQLRFSFNVFVTDGTKATWDELKDVLVAYETSIASLIFHLRGLDPWSPPPLLWQARAGWLQPLLTKVEPPNTPTETRLLLKLIEHSENLVEDLHEANRLVTGYHERLYEIVLE